MCVCVCVCVYVCIYVSCIKKSNHGIIWFEIDKSLFQHGHDVYMCNVYYYPYRAFGDQNKIVYSTRFVRREIFFLYCPDFM